MDLFCCAFTVAAELILPLIARYITSAAGDDPAALSASLIINIGLCYLGLRLLDALAEFYKSSFGHITGAQIEADMRRDLFAHMQLLSYSYYDNTKIGQLMSRITSDLNDVTEFAHHFPEELLSAVLKIGISFAILANTNLPMTLIIFSILPVMLFCTLSFRFKMKRAFQETRHHLGEINAQVEDSLLGIRAVKSFGNEQVESKKFGKNNHRFLSIKRRSYLYMGISRLWYPARSSSRPGKLTPEISRLICCMSAYCSRPSAASSSLWSSSSGASQASSGSLR